MTERAQNADFRRKPQIFADSPLLLEIPAFGGRRKPQKTAHFRRKPQIFAENRRKPQIGLRHLRCVTFSSALSWPLRRGGRGWFEGGVRGSVPNRPLTMRSQPKGPHRTKNTTRSKFYGGVIYFNSVHTTGELQVTVCGVRKRAEYGFGEYGFKHRTQWVFLGSLSSGERTQWVPLSLLFVCRRELTELFAELTEFDPKLSEFSSPKQYSRNSIPPVS